jgi:uncharacterized protein (TIGR02302 family)
MIDPIDRRYRPFLLFLERKRRGASLVLTLEKVICHVWRILFWCLFFAGLWMLSLPAFFGTFVSVITLLTFLTGITYFTRKDFLNFSFPNPDDIDRRLEKRSALGRGHIALVEDQLANPSIISTRLLWHKAQREGVFRLKKLRIPWPKTYLSRKDPHALRFIAILVFTAGIFVAGHSWKERIISGLMPISPTWFSISQENQSIDLWIKPPDYTQMPEMHLSGSGRYDGELNIPEGSTYRIRMHSWLKGIFAPHLHTSAANVVLTYMEGDLYGKEGTIQPGTSMRITQALLPRATWPYHYIIDMPPEIRGDLKTDKEIKTTEVESETQQTTPKEDDAQNKVVQPYEILDDGQIRFPLAVKDDYGVKELKMNMRFDEMIKETPLGQEVEETRLIMSQPNKEFKIAPIYDLSWHSWAGLPVTIEFTAIDHKGQKTKLEGINLILPEREFKHPLAKALINTRKKLAWNYKGPLRDISLEIESYLSNPDLFQNDPVVFLAIRSASSRLFHNKNKPATQKLKSVREVIALLWETALVIEEGDVVFALRELRNAQRELENAMRDPNADDREIQALMEQLREKMIDYFTEVHREMQKHIEKGENMPFMSPEDFGTLITPDTLASLMAQIEQAMREGNNQKAQELMSQLQRMMEMIDPSKGAKLPRDMQMMRKGINELQKLIERQELLIEQTQKQADTQLSLEKPKTPPSSGITQKDLPALEQMLEDFGMDTIPPVPQNTSPEQPNKDESSQQQIDTSQNKVEQDALRYILGQLMMEAADKLDEVPEKMGMAEQEMRKSANELGKNNPKDSVPHQKTAVQYLKDAQEGMAKQFRQRMQQMVGIGLSGNGQRLDPLGRPYNDTENGQNPENAIKIPDESQKKRVDDIIRQLRRRSGDRSRSREELEYYQRLLRQF